MPFAVTHVLITIIIIELIRDYFIKDKEKFPLNLVLIGGIAGLLPDIDYFLYWFLNLKGVVAMDSVHRLLTHSLLFPAILIIIGYFTYFKNNKKATYWIMTIAIALVIHTILDAITGQTAMLAPFTYHMMGFNLLPDTEMGRSITLAIDTVILIGWLIYMEARHKLSQFI